MYNDFDFNELQKATREQLAKIYKESLEEQEMVDAEKVDETYCKIRKLLDCPEMEKCHPFLYSLDMENVNESDTEKVNKIYDLAIDRGMISKDEDNEESDSEVETDDCDGDCEDGQICGGPSDALTDQQMVPQTMERKPIFTVMYSAQKDGSGSMGEFYSMAPTIEGAKEECRNQLMASGFNSVMIMAVDQSFPAVNTDVDDSWVDKSLENVTPCCEDDSEEFLKQETGDTSTEEESDGDEDNNTEDTESKVETTVSDDDTTEQSVENDDEKGTEETPAEKSSEEKDENSEDDAKDTEKKDVEDENNEESTEEQDSESEDKDDDEEVEEEPKKLTAEEKTVMKDEYTKVFKDVLKKMEIEKSV